MASEENGVIQFTCEHCKISLTVADSLAGVSGPCPSCGKPTKAPDQKLRWDFADHSSGGRRHPESVRSAGGKHFGRRLQPRQNVRAKRSRKRVSETQLEREEVAAVTKLLLIGFIVLVVVLVAAYYGYQAFKS